MHSPKTIAHARRKNRIRARISGTPLRPRLVVHRSNRYMTAQVVDDTAGKVLASAHDLKLKKGSKLERAKTVGALIAKVAQEKKIEGVVFDRSGYRYHGRVKALAEAAREAGLKF
jgi:large subunit ribosomal protein L18